MTLKWTYHGGRLTEARTLYGDDKPWLDLSTGINPHAWPHIDHVGIDWRRLPDESALAMLEAAAAAHFGVPSDHVAALPGTEMGLRLLESLLPGPARHVWPAYRTHAEMFAASAPLTLFQLEGRGGDVGIIANPNNPDGRILGREPLLQILERQRSAGGWLVVDEAFVDAHEDLSLAPHIADDQPLVLFRSFGKFFGLAGLRLGFAIGPRPLLEALRRKLGAWPVSAAAIAIGTAAYADAKWITAMRARLQREALALQTVLEGHGLPVMGDCPLFRLVQADDAGGLFERLARQAILTRPFDYDPRWLRIGLPEDIEALNRLDEALRSG